MYFSEKDMSFPCGAFVSLDERAYDSKEIIPHSICTLTSFSFIQDEEKKDEAVDAPTDEKKQDETVEKKDAPAAEEPVAEEKKVEDQPVVEEKKVESAIGQEKKAAEAPVAQQ